MNGSEQHSKGLNRRIRIFLIDDHPSVLAGIRSHLGRRRDFMVVGQALDGAMGILRANEVRPDIVIIDLSLPRTNGLEVIGRIHQNLPTAKLIAYSIHSRKEFVRRALKAGAMGYVTKASSLKELVRSIDNAVKGEVYIDREIANEDRALIGEIGRARRGSESCIEKECSGYNLSEREREVLKKLADGQVIKEIAFDLLISYNTTMHHVGNIYKKLDVGTRGAAVAKAVREGLL